MRSTTSGVIFNWEYVIFLIDQHFFPLKDAATTLLAREKATFLAELFPVELKFTIDTLNNRFWNRIKPKFLELRDVKRKDFIEKNKLSPETIYCICGFLVHVNAWGEKNDRIL